MNEEIQRKLERNIRGTLGLGFFHVFLVIMPIIVPFFQSHGLSMQDVFALQAVFAFVVLVMEVPSGYVADLLGRKLTLVVGAAFLGLGHSLLLFADGFAMLCLFEVALGIGSSLLSGADLAMLYDSEQALHAEPGRQQQAVSRLFSMHTTAESIASVLCSVLMLLSMQAVVWAQVLAGWMPLLLALTLFEPPAERLERGAHTKNFVAILKHLLRDDAVLRLTFLTLSIWGLTTFYAVWLLQRVWQDHDIALEHFGYLWAVLMLTSAVTGRMALRVERRVGVTTLLVVVGLAPVLGYVGLASFGLWGGLAASLTFFVSRGLGIVVLRDAFNKRVPGRFRATANSLVSFMFRGTFALTGPFVGQALDLWGMATALWLLALASLAIFVGLMLPLIVAVREGAATVPAVPEPADL